MSQLISSLLRPRTPREKARTDKLVHTDNLGRQAVLVELQVGHGELASAVCTRFTDIFNRAFAQAAKPPRAPIRISTLYMQCRLSGDEVDALVAADGQPRSIYHIWPDYILHPHIDRSAATVKADAAFRTYAASGSGVVWAVLDSGIDQSHAHFHASDAGGEPGTLLDPVVASLHRDFTGLVTGEAPDADSGAAPGPPRPALDLIPSDPGPALCDNFGHGTHVAGIIAGSAPKDPNDCCIVTNRPTTEDLPHWTIRQLSPDRALTGVAPRTRLVSLKVLTDDEHTLSSAVIAALNYVRQVNSGGRELVIHGVNLSLGCEWFPPDFAAGQSPLCRELDLLVGSGVVAVVSAGNGGDVQGETGDFYGRLSTITDPGNAAKAITVGSTHRDQPHVYGVTYTSSKGPTLDGRLKPDLVAPGESITSAATGTFRAKVPEFQQLAGTTTACYIEESGTSMAAPHVSGAIAAFLSVRPEFKGRPEEIKEMFMRNATSLGRHPFFEGSGLVDLMRVLNSI